MAGKKTHAEGNRVTIDDVDFLVTTAGANQYSVANEFGDRLGYFRVRGKTVTPEDYKLTGAPPLVQIARLWASVNLAKDEKHASLQTRGYCQVMRHEGGSEEDLQAARAHRGWLKRQPGMRASYLVRDPDTGKAMTIAIWQSRGHLDAADKAGPKEGAPLAPTTTEAFPFVEEP